VAGIAAQLTVDLDFRSGGPAQVQQRITANGRAEIRQLAAAAGLDAGGLASGPATAQMTYTRRRDGGGELRLGADLRESTLEFSPLGWRKPPGTVASGEAKLRIQRDRILSVDDIVLTGDALSLRGRIEQQDGRLAMLRLERVLLGRTEAQGSVSFQPAGGRISVALRGGLLDLGPRLTTPTVPPPPARAEAAADRAWSLDARFDTAILAHDVRMTNLSVTADSNGAFMQRLRLDATTQGGPTHLEISPAGVAGAGRRLSASSADAGTLLRRGRGWGSTS